MLFRSYRPFPPLSHFVENLWLYSGFEPARLKEAIFPSGTVELVFNLHDDEIRIYKNARSDEYQRYSGAIASGPYAGPFVTDTTLEACVMGVHFKPGGAFAFLDCNVGDLRDSHFDLQAIWGAAAGELRERLCGTVSSARRFRLVEEFLKARLRRLEQHSAVALALSRLRGAESQMTRELAQDAGLSEKRFIDVFRFEVGLNPKLFTRIRRFQRVLGRANRPAVQDWADVALQHGYFDQSHLIRDYVAFTGISPTDYVHCLDYLRSRNMDAKFNHLPLVR